MCNLCVDAMDRHFPDMDRNDYYLFLIEFTAFPFSSAGETARQIESLSKGVSEGVSG